MRNVLLSDPETGKEARSRWCWVQNPHACPVCVGPTHGPDSLPADQAGQPRAWGDFAMAQPLPRLLFVGTEKSRWGPRVPLALAAGLSPGCTAVTAPPHGPCGVGCVGAEPGQDGAIPSDFSALPSVPKWSPFYISLHISRLGCVGTATTCRKVPLVCVTERSHPTSGSPERLAVSLPRPLSVLFAILVSQCSSCQTVLK